MARLPMFETMIGWLTHLHLLQVVLIDQPAAAARKNAYSDRFNRVTRALQDKSKPLGALVGAKEEKTALLLLRQSIW